MASRYMSGRAREAANAVEWCLAHFDFPAPAEIHFAPKVEKEKVFEHKAWHDKPESERDLCGFLGCNFHKFQNIDVKELIE